MGFRSILYILCVFALSLYGSNSYAQQSTVALTADDIMRLAIENMNQNDLLKKELVSFERIETEHELHKNGRDQSILNNKKSYHGNLYASDIRGEDSGLSINFNTILRLAYDYQFIDPNGSYYKKLPERYKFTCNDCYIIWFGPKAIMPNVENIAPPNADAIGRGLHESAMRMTGIIYIDKNHMFIKKYTGGLDRSFSKAKSAVKVMLGYLDLDQEIRPDLNNIVVLTSSKMTYQVRITWFYFRTRRIEWEWSNYRLNSDYPPAQ